MTTKAIPHKEIDVLRQRVADLEKQLAEQEQTLSTLQASEERFHAVLNNLSDAPYRRNLRTDRYDYLSPVIEQLTGWTVEEMNQADLETVLNWIHPDDLPQLQQEIERTNALCRETGRATGSLEYRFRTKAGDYCWLGDYLTVIAGNDGQPLYRLGVIRDITERKQAENKLHQSQQKYTLLFEKSVVPAVLLKLPEVVIVDANEAFEKLSGFTRPEMVGKTAVDLGLARPEAREQTTARFRQRNVLEGQEIPVFTKSGEERLVIINTSPLELDGQDYALSMVQDITTLKRAEEAQQDSLAKLERLFEILPVGISVLNHQRQVVKQNPALENIVGMSAEGLARGDYLQRQYIRPDGTAMPPEEFASARVMQGEPSALNVETGIIQEDGRVTWTSVSAAVVPFSDWSVVIVTQDITAKKQAEQALQASQQNLAALIENTDASIWSVDTQYRVIVGNQLYHRNVSAAIGRSLIPGESVLSLNLPPAALDEWRGYYDRALGGETFSVETSTRFTAEVRTIEYRFNPIRTSEGQITGVTVFGRDITERKQAEKEIRRQADVLYEQAKLLDQAHVLIRDMDNRIVYWNQGMEELYGWTKEEALGQLTHTFLQTQFPESRVAYQSQLMQTGQWAGELTHITKADKKITVASHQTLHYDQTGQPVRILEVNNDITERKRVEDELRRSNAELEQFAYVASHDLQEPLRAVAGLMQLLQQRYHGRLDESADEYIELAVEGASRMQTLINDLLTYSRVGRRGKPFEPVNAGTCLQTALQNLKVAIAESQAVITYDNLPTVTADSTQLIQLFQNLIGNSLKFRSDQTPQIRINAVKMADCWQFAVRDNGIGIEPQYFKRIFQVFQRLHTRDDYPGTGIGLALCQKIVERHGGAIWVESQGGQGSTFYFTLPSRNTINDKP